MGTNALIRFLKTHRRSCTVHIFSGDRHCSCGRDEALWEIELLQNSGIIPSMELPDRCPHCQHQNMVDFGNLERRPLSKLYIVEGYVCSACDRWKPIYYTTRALDENFKRLNNLPPMHRSFLYHFLKTVKRAMEIQERGRSYGEIGHKDLAESR